MAFTRKMEEVMGATDVFLCLVSKLRILLLVLFLLVLLILVVVVMGILMVMLVLWWWCWCWWWWCGPRTPSRLRLHARYDDAVR